MTLKRKWQQRGSWTEGMSMKMLLIPTPSWNVDSFVNRQQKAAEIEAAGVFPSGLDGEMGQTIMMYLMNTWPRAPRTSDCAEGSCRPQIQQCGSVFQTTLYVLECTNQSFYRNQRLWSGLKMAVYQQSPSKITGLKGLCREVWNITKSISAKLVASEDWKL